MPISGTCPAKTRSLHGLCIPLAYFPLLSPARPVTFLVDRILDEICIFGSTIDQRRVI